MEGIGRNCVVVEQPKKGNKAAKHLLNAGVATAGVAASVRGARLVASKFDLANAAKYGAANIPYGQAAHKLHKFVTKWSEKLIPDKSKLGKIINKIAGKGFAIGGKPRMLSMLKGKTLIGAVAAAAILGILGIATYTAGHINGKN